MRKDNFRPKYLNLLYYIGVSLSYFTQQVVLKSEANVMRFTKTHILIKKIILYIDYLFHDCFITSWGLTRVAVRKKV